MEMGVPYVDDAVCTAAPSRRAAQHDLGVKVGWEYVPVPTIPFSVLYMILFPTISIF